MIIPIIRAIAPKIKVFFDLGEGGVGRGVVLVALVVVLLVVVVVVVVVVGCSENTSR